VRADDVTPEIIEDLTQRERDALREPATPYIRVICTPAQHQSGRYAVDACSALWSSWVVEYHHTEGEGKGERRCFRTFFGGDTGYRFHDTVKAAEQEAEAKARKAALDRQRSSTTKSSANASSSLSSSSSSDKSSGEGEAGGKGFKKFGKRLSISLSRPNSRTKESAAPRQSSPEAVSPVNGSTTTEGADIAKEADPAEALAQSATVAAVEDEARANADADEDPNFPACPAFTHIVDALGPPNLLLLPISVGATISFLKSYDPLPPRWSPFPRVDERLTSAVHMGPEDAVRVLQLMTAEARARVGSSSSGGGGKEVSSEKKKKEEDDDDDQEHSPPPSTHLRRYAHLGASPSAPSSLEHGATALAIHWGTFVGGKDEVHQSIRALRRACGKEGVRFAREHDEGAGGGERTDGKNTFALVNHGESVTLRL